MKSIDLSRRNFARVAGSLAIGAVPLYSAPGPSANDVAKLIRERVGGDWPEKGLDGFKAAIGARAHDLHTRRHSVEKSLVTGSRRPPGPWITRENRYVEFLLRELPHNTKRPHRPDPGVRGKVIRNNERTRAPSAGAWRRHVVDGLLTI